MNCDEAKNLLLDRADGLLAEPVRDALDAHVRSCPACNGEAERVAALRSAVYRPAPVEAPPLDLPARIVAASVRARPWRWAGIVRYAAAFVAGVAATLAVQETSEPAPPAPAFERKADPVPEREQRVHRTPYQPRRLR